ncbi:beta strand repeat-containing protein [Massilia sp.]|uniref:beta strand repeat-containing protein n=1 Tax=Massilia sp. TaxID=1882437 RepID=UPI00352CC9F6
MAAQAYTDVVQQLYVSYFGRPADYYGLQNFAAALDKMGAPTDFAAVQAAVQADKAGTTALSQLVNSFNSSAESVALYGNDNSQIGIGKFVNAIYQNVLGRDADKSGFDFWVNAINTGALTKANAAAAITQAALTNTSDQGKLDALTVQNKLAVAKSFTDALDTPAEITSFSGDAAAAAARSLLLGVNSSTNLTAYQANINETIDKLGNVVNGQTFSTTVGVDTLAGTSGNDVFNALNIGADGHSSDSTLSAFDSIDGGAGKDTLNIYTDGVENVSIPANATIKNIETVNIINTGAAAAGLTDASKYAGVTALWQTGAAANVANLAATTTAGFHGLNGTVGIAPVDAAATATIALDKAVEGSILNVTSGAAGTLATVVVGGTVVDGTDGGSDVGNINLNIKGGKDVQTVMVNTAVATTVTTTDNGKAVTTIDASASTGAIKFAGGANTVANIKTGSGNDDVTLVAATVKDKTNATVNTGAGNDKITVNASGDGIVTITAGDGNDTVNVTGRSSGALNVDLGAGNDTFTSTVDIGANDKIDAGAGTDTLLLNLVGSANVGAFSNFDAFDAKGLSKALDIDILSLKNTVTEIVASGDVGLGASLENVGAGVGYRVTGNTAGNVLTINQKVAGDLTVTLDIDESGDAKTTTAADANAAVNAKNATGVKVVFDSSFVDASKAAGDNAAALTLTATAAKTIAVTSGGANAENHLVLTASDALTSVTVTGASELVIDSVTGATKLASIDASAATGGLTASLADVANGGTIKLGTGADMITITSASTVGAVESISGFEKTAAAAVGSDATAKAAAIADADVLSFAGTVAADGGQISKGVLSFTGAGPSTLADAVGLADGAATVAGSAVVFEYLGNSYVFVQGGATDTLVQLAGITGIKNFAEDGATDHFFIV